MTNETQNQNEIQETPAQRWERLNAILLGIHEEIALTVTQRRAYLES